MKGLIVALVVMSAPAIAIASDLDNEWDGKDLFACSFVRAGRTATKAIKADEPEEAVDKVYRWAKRNNATISGATCERPGL